MHDESMPNPRPSQTPVVLRLWIDTPAATSEQLQRGIDAAREVFDKAGTNPWEAACAAEDEARDDDAGITRRPAKNDPEPLPPTIDELRHNQLANAWHEAYWAALTAGFGYDLDDEGDDLSFDADPTALDITPVPDIEFCIRPASSDDPADRPCLEFRVPA